MDSSLVKSTTGFSRIIDSTDLSPMIADFCGILIPRLRGNLLVSQVLHMGLI